MDGAIFRLSKAEICLCKDGVDYTAEKLLRESIYNAWAVIMIFGRAKSNKRGSEENRNESPISAALKRYNQIDWLKYWPS